MTTPENTTDPGSDEAVAAVEGQPGTTGDQRSESQPSDQQASEAATAEAEELGEEGADH